jgi:ABC-type antimicrobial peptide transport system permease subunit
MLTNLGSLGVLTNPQFYEGADPSAPISVIRVRVADATGPDPVSRERVRRVAQAIHELTGLDVDITVGSSPTPMLIHLRAGEFGRPALTVQEGWVKKGVAVVILRAIDSKSLALFLLVLVVSGFFLANGALASVRARRTEIGTLLCIGWPRGRIYQAILGELALIGLASGLVGTLIALGLVGLLDLQMATTRTLVVTPVAVLLAAVAGLIPAWRAARSIPLDAIRPPVTDRFSARNVSHMWIMAFTNLRRLPGRTLLGMAALFVSVAGMAALLSINLAFQGLLSNSLLGTFISLQVRGVDYLSIGLAVAVGALSVADVLFLNVRERGAELATLLASGWTKRNVARLVVLEGIILGFIGSTAGAVVGVGLAALLGGPALRMILTGLLAVALAVALVALASLVPARLVGRMAPTVLLAEE